MRAARIIRDAAGMVTWALLWALRLVWAPYLLLRIDVLDWLLLILTIKTDRWEAAALFLIQFAARRAPFLARSLVGLAGLPEDAEWVGWIMPGLIMSRGAEEQDSDRAVVALFAQQVGEATQRIATPGNGDNGLLPGNGIAPALSDEVRDIIRIQAKAEALAALIGRKKINQTEGLEIVFGARSSRPDSPYARGREALLCLTAGPQYPALTPEQEELRQQLGLKKEAA